MSAAHSTCESGATPANDAGICDVDTAASEQEEHEAMAEHAEEARELLRLRAKQRGVNYTSASFTGGRRRELPEELSASRRRQWALFSIVGGLIYGYNVSLAASLQYVRDELQLSSTQQEIVSATATLSDAASMLVGGRLADAYGRKSVALVACVCSIAGALGASGFSSGFATLFFWRLVSGVGNGLSILLLPMYISESVAADSRGTFLTLFQLGVNSGVAVPYLFMIFISESWRACLAVGSLPALYVFYCFYVHFPESVKWLRWKENPTHVDDLETASAIDNARNNDNNSDDDELTTRSSDVSSQSVESARPQPHLELLIGILLAYVNNCVDASLFYGPTIIATAVTDFTRRDANVFGLLCALVAVASVLFAARYLIDRYPRRELYLLCLAVVCVCFVLSGAIFASYAADGVAASATASTSIMVAFAVLNVFAAVGPSVLFVVILSELFQDSSYRARYMSYCTFAMSLISLLVNGTLLSLFEALGTATTFFAYGLSYVACLAFLWKYLPETKQRELV